MFTGHHHLSFSCSHELEKNVVKKKIRTMKKADTESKIAMKKDAIQLID
jgi:hypothetical protein